MTKQIDVEPEGYRRIGSPRIIPRRQALMMLPFIFVACGFLEWLFAEGAPDWWYGLITWPALMMAGAFITRLWPLFFLKDDD